MLANIGESIDTVGTSQLYPLGSLFYEPPPYVADGTDAFTFDVPMSTTTTGGAEVTKPEGKEEKHPYLWVGARIAWERMTHSDANYHYDDGSLLLAVYEPPKVGGLPNGIVSYPPVRWYDEVDDANPSLAGGDTFSDLNPRPEAVKARWWLSPNFATRPYYPPQGIGATNASRPLVQMTDHGLYLVSSHLETTSPNYAGLRRDSVPEAGLAFQYGGMDVPYHPIEEQGVENADAWQDRMWGPAGAYQDELGGWPLWTVVAVLDPEPWLPPSDTRDLLGLFGEEGGFKQLDIYPAVIGGKYIIKVGCGTQCTYNGNNMHVDLEVIVGKHPWMTRKRFEIVVPRGSYWAGLQVPYGYAHPHLGSATVCGWMRDSNPHWTNWYQGAITADVISGTIKHEEQTYIPSHGFDGVKEIGRAHV